MTEREALSTARALKLALEALVKTDAEPGSKAWEREAEAITAIKEALMSGTDGAQPEQEPDYYGLTADQLWMSISKDHYDRLKPEYRMTCYTTPPHRTWVGLTDEEVNKLVDDEDWYNFPHEFAKAVEAKLKEKNI